MSKEWRWSGTRESVRQRKIMHKGSMANGSVMVSYYHTTKHQQSRKRAHHWCCPFVTMESLVPWRKSTLPWSRWAELQHLGWQAGGKAMKVVCSGRARRSISNELWCCKEACKEDASVHYAPIHTSVMCSPWPSRVGLGDKKLKGPQGSTSQHYPLHKCRLQLIAFDCLLQTLITPPEAFSWQKESVTPQRRPSTNDGLGENEKELRCRASKVPPQSCVHLLW